MLPVFFIMLLCDNFYIEILMVLNLPGSRYCAHSLITAVTGREYGEIFVSTAA